MKNNKKTIARLMTYITKEYKLRFLIVLICIFISSLSNVSGSLFIQILIDDYITPLLLMGCFGLSSQWLPFMLLAFAQLFSITGLWSPLPKEF